MFPYKSDSLHVMFKVLHLRVLHVYVSGGERESAHPTSFALFMTPEYGTKEKRTSRSYDINGRH